MNFHMHDNLNYDIMIILHMTFSIRYVHVHVHAAEETVLEGDYIIMYYYYNVQCYSTLYSHLLQKL